jgi:hypothetical protein
MAAVSFQPITLPAQDAGEQTSARGASQAPASNPQPAATPNDTVSLSSAAIAVAQPGQGAGRGGADFVAQGPSVLQISNLGAVAANSSQVAATNPVAAANAVVAPAASQAKVNSGATGTTSVLTTGAATSQGTLNSSAQTAQQQQLAQLDQLLSALGVDPQSIPLFNQLSLLRYLNDPFRLRQLVQQLQTVSPVEANPPEANSGAAQAANEAAKQPAASKGQNAQNAPGAEANGFAAQFQELQVSLAATAVEEAPEAGNGGSGQSGQTLNVSY